MDDAYLDHYKGENRPKRLSASTTGLMSPNLTPVFEGELIMTALLRAAAAVGVTVLAGAAAVWGAGPLRETGVLPELAQPAPPSVFDQFDGRPGADNLASDVNAACGFHASLQPGGTRLFLDEASESLVISTADAGDDTVLRRSSASADTLIAYSVYGSDELFIQTGADGAASLGGRTFMLDDAGEVAFTEPLLERTTLALTCADAPLAAERLNAHFRAFGPAVDPIRSGLHAFAYGRGDPLGLVQACTPDRGITDLADGEPALIAANFDPNVRYGPDISHEISGESLEGNVEPMVLLTVATAHADYGDIKVYKAPLFWRDALAGEDSFAMVYQFNAAELVGSMVEGDGSQTHSMSGGGLLDFAIPCANPETAVSLLRDLRDEQMNSSAGE
jgi:hypothetical protein